MLTLIPANYGHDLYRCKNNQDRICYTFQAFNALTLLVGRQEKHPACKTWVMRCWCGHLSGARCRLFAYGPADATAIPKPHNLLPHLKPDWLYLSGTGLPRLSWKRGLETGVVVVVFEAQKHEWSISCCVLWLTLHSIGWLIHRLIVLYWSIQPYSCKSV